MILLNIDKKQHAGHLYQQIYKELKQKILDRKYHAHEKLPAKRALANQLDVSINTITNAYEQLLEEGYIYSIERSGYYIEDITRFVDYQTKTENLPEHLKEKPKEKEGWLSFSHMTANVDLFPFKDWLKSEKEAIANHQAELAEITHFQGPYQVRKTIAKLIGLNRGVKCDPEQIILSVGTQPLIKQLFSTQPKDTIIAMESPGYSRIFSLLSQQLQLPVDLLSLDANGVNINEVEQSNADFLFVTPSHQFPTGKIMTISRRIELLNWALKKDDRYIIEDDYDSEFKYKTDNIPSLQSLDQHQRVIYLGTFSKSLLPSFRISYMILPPNLLEEYRRKHENLIHYNNTLVLYTLHYFIQSGAYDSHIKRMNHQYDVKRTLLISELTTTFGDDISIKDIPAGLHFVAQFNTKKTYDEIEQAAKDLKLEIYTMRRFHLKEQSDHTENIELVIGFANIKEEDIKEAVARLRQVIY